MVLRAVHLPGRLPAWTHPLAPLIVCYRHRLSIASLWRTCVYRNSRKRVAFAVVICSPIDLPSSPTPACDLSTQWPPLRCIRIICKTVPIRCLFTLLAGIRSYYRITNALSTSSQTICSLFRVDQDVAVPATLSQTCHTCRHHRISPVFNLWSSI